ncbi:MAG: hypothetical protein WEE89_00640 [Gemmatimonadota bacterium]
MNAKLVIAGLAGVCLTVGNAAAQQSPTRMGGLMVSAFVGGSANSDLQRSGARAEWLARDGPESRQFARRLTAETAGVVGLSAAYWFNPYWGVRTQAAFTPSRLEIAVSQRETHDIPIDAEVTGPSRYGAFRVWTYDANLLFRAPVTPRGRVALYGFVGGGVVKYEVSVEQGLPPEAVQAFADQESKTQPVGVLGIGAMVPLHRKSLGLSFELSDHISRTPVQGSPESSIVGVNRVQVTTGEETGPSRVQLINHVRILVGLTWRAR